jgi:hypothetical protein
VSPAFSEATAEEESIAVFNVDPNTEEVSFNFSGPPATMRWRILGARARLFDALGPISPYTAYQTVNEGQLTRKFVLPKGTIFATNVPRKDCMRVVAARDDFHADDLLHWRRWHGRLHRPVHWRRIQQPVCLRGALNYGDRRYLNLWKPAEAGAVADG